MPYALRRRVRRVRRRDIACRYARCAGRAAAAVDTRALAPARGSATVLLPHADINRRVSMPDLRAGGRRYAPGNTLQSKRRCWRNVDVRRHV